MNMSNRQKSLRSTQVASLNVSSEEKPHNSSPANPDSTAEPKLASKSANPRKRAKKVSSSGPVKVYKPNTKEEPESKSHRKQTSPTTKPNHQSLTVTDTDDTSEYIPPEPLAHHHSEAPAHRPFSDENKASPPAAAEVQDPQTYTDRRADQPAMSRYLSSEAMRVRLATASDVTLDEILCEAFHSNNDTASVLVPGLSTNRLGAYMLFVSRIYNRRGIALREQEREAVWRACFPEDFDELALQMTAFVIYTFRDIFKHVQAVEGFEQASRRERIEVATMCTRAFWDAVLDYVGRAYARFGQDPPDTFALTARMERVVNDTILRSPGVTVDL